MKNVTINIDAETVARIVEEHINQELAENQRAKASCISAGYDSNPAPNQPATTLCVIFDTVQT